MIVLNNFLDSSKLKFNDVVRIILSEEVQRKSLGDSSVSGSALNMEKRGRLSVKGFGSSWSKSRRISGVQCFCYKEFGHM